MKVLHQNWEESERGWGVRPDGYSIHPNKAALDRYVKAYWKEMPDDVPDEYSRPCGDAVEVEATKDMIKALGKKDGARFYK